MNGLWLIGRQMKRRGDGGNGKPYVLWCLLRFCVYFRLTSFCPPSCRVALGDSLAEVQAADQKLIAYM